jgi:hypothetical protein
MTTISIIGSGNMATAIGTRAAKHGHTIEGVGPLLMGLARHGAGFNIALGVNVSG